jgi:TetR/AcrR family transcriptional regulator, cholesterol catabolism regulator
VKAAAQRLQIDGRAAEIYRTAARIILEKGYDATSVSDIAAALGITKAGLYHYIKGKTELLFEIMKFGLEALDEEVLTPAREIEDPEERLRFVITTHARAVIRGDGVVTILVDEARALTPVQSRTVKRMKRKYIDLLRETLGELQKRRRLRDGVDLTVAAFSIAGAVNWLSRWYHPEGRLTPDELGEQIAGIALNGMMR